MLAARPAPAFTTIAATTRIVDDVDAMSAAMCDGLQGDYLQLAGTPFRGRWSMLRFGPVIVQFGSADTAVSRRMRLPANRWGFVVPLDVPPAARWNGRPVVWDGIVVAPPEGECLAFDPPFTRFAIVTAGGTTAAVREASRLFRSRPAAPLATSCGEQARALRDRLIGLRDRVEANLRDFGNPGDVLDSSVASCLERAAASPPAIARRWTRSQIVCAAAAFFRRHVKEAVSVAQLSRAAGVRERTLRNAFHDVCAMSPQRYMKLVRLHLVHRGLRRGAAKVTDLATRYGCFELGRFAGEYRSIFGETPSETLNRARTHLHDSMRKAA